MHPSKFLTLALASSVSALPVLTLPWFGHISLDGVVGYLGYMRDLAEDKTIYQVLKDDRQYSRLVKAIDLSESVVDLLNDPSKSITFFAVPNSKFPHHHHHHHKHHHCDHRHNESLIPILSESLNDVNHNLGDLVQQAEALEEEPESVDKERCKEVLARIVHKILAYHILPGSYETADLVQNSTHATNLTLLDGSLDGKPLRLSILGTAFPPRLRINLFVEVIRKSIKAKNGVIHQINRPLLPPPSIFQETFFVPKVFAFFTSAIQRVGLRSAVDRWRCSGDDGHKVSFLGATTTTVFAPTSGAFERLPKKLKMYLFSPFGQRALKKLLEYHIVPNAVLFTDYFHNSTSDVTELGPCFEGALETRLTTPVFALLDGDAENFLSSTNTGPLLEAVYEYNTTLPTLLQGHQLRIHVARFKSSLPLPGFPRYFTIFKVNGHRVRAFDIPARNGALHVLSTLLDPRKGHDHHADNGNGEADWEDWEDWLPQWAIED